MFHSASTKSLSSVGSVNGHFKSRLSLSKTEKSISNMVNDTASQFDEDSTQLKLSLLVESSSKFWEMADLGFPVSIEDLHSCTRDSTPRDSTGTHSTRTSIVNNITRESTVSFDNARNVRVPSLSSNRSSNESSSSNTHDTISSPILRQKTLRFTLTPKSMRADESIIYGWQGDEKPPFESTPEDVQMHSNDNSSNEKLHVQHAGILKKSAPESTMSSDRHSGMHVPVRKESVKLGAQRIKGFMTSLTRGKEPKKPTYMITSADI